jgi:hypothetical protein
MLSTGLVVDLGSNTAVLLVYLATMDGYGCIPALLLSLLQR